MNTFLDRAFPFLQKHEGGYSNRRNDSGGPTMRGVTQRTYDAYRQHTLGLGTKPVIDITDEEVYAIFLKYYWVASRAEELPPIVGIALFDFYVQNQREAVRNLQLTANMNDVDGVIGPNTIRAVIGKCSDDETTLLFTRDYLRARKSFYQRLVVKHPQKKEFLNGWLGRVADLADMLKVSDNYLNK